MFCLFLFINSSNFLKMIFRKERLLKEENLLVNVSFEE